MTFTGGEKILNLFYNTKETVGNSPQQSISLKL